MIALQSLSTLGILFPSDAGAADVARTGGKAGGLLRLGDAGCNVPPWFVVTPDWTENDAESLDAAVARLDGPFAVRSSAVVEDGAQASFAGQFASLLFVPREGVAAAIRRVRDSASSAALRAYAGGACADRMAVIVQRMVSGEASGVAFGIDPIDGADVVVVTAAAGLAAAVVDGDALTDTWRVARDGTIAARTLAAPGRQRAVLDDAQVNAVASLARRIANAAGAPQDVEFTFAAGRLWALQARPVTAVPAAPVAIWDDSNIAESYGGVVGALTYSFARHAYAGAYRSFFRIVAVPRETIDAQAETFEGLVGRIEGRMMYDLVRWYRMLALLPGYRLNRRLMDEMMGVREAIPPALAEGIARSCRRGKLRDAAMLARTALALAVAAALLPRDVRRFHAHVDATLAGGPALERASLGELAAEYRRLERALLERWNVPIANDFFVMLSFGLLKRAAQHWCGEDALAPALLAASGGMMSAEPARAVRRLAALQTTGESDAFARELAAYLDRFGDRCEGELKLESRTLHDDPRPLLEAIARLGATAFDDADAGAVRMRCEAEQRACTALRGRPLQRFALARLTGWARARIVARENMRFERTRVFGRVRRIVLAMGRVLARRGVLDDARDVFDLTIDELFGYVEGNAASRELRALAAVRRAENARYAAAAPPPGRFATRDLPVAPLAAPPPEACDDATRSGTPCCPGIVRARVRVVRDPSEALRPGEILVAERTDPSWVVLFPAAAAILVERGSQLSHAAIVSREMGIPSVVAVRGLCAWLHDGDLVELDGATGTVRRLEVAS